ncbi:MAG: type II toxin-antitoxin system HicB family antitoxin [Ignavibacteriae bacterium]|nr:type II toxin-antitoxin system HicB family antitoxin [Ignavibacteriota bacterium]
MFDIIVHEAEEGGYWGECPALEGCYSQGDSLDEFKANMKEAIELYIETILNKKKRISTQRKVFVMPIAV